MGPAHGRAAQEAQSVVSPDAAGCTSTIGWITAIAGHIIVFCQAVQDENKRRLVLASPAAFASSIVMLWSASCKLVPDVSASAGRLPSKAVSAIGVLAEGCMPQADGCLCPAAVNTTGRLASNSSSPFTMIPCVKRCCRNKLRTVWGAANPTEHGGRTGVAE